MKIAPRRTVAGLMRTAVPQAGRYGMLRLDKNERCVGYPDRVVRAMMKGLSGEQLAAYPEPGPLYERLAKHHGVGVDRLAVTAGSELAIRYLFEAFLDPQDEVLLLNPSFAMFEVYARLCGARPVGVDFTPQWRVEPDDILRRITDRTKIVALANPNNPTGTVLEEPVLLDILRRAARHGALVLMDEAYYHFYGRTMVGHLPRFDNLVVTRTFSKSCGAAGVRLGYAIGHPDVIAVLNRVQPIDHVSVFAVRVGEYLMEHKGLIKQYVRQVEAGKRYLLGQLERLEIPAFGSHANFVLVEFGRSKDRLVRLLRDRGILIGASLRLPFPSSLVRVTAGPVPVMRQVLAVLGEAVAGRGGRG